MSYQPRERSLTAVREARPTCYKCLRPQTHCVCLLVPQFRAHCNLLILQHPHERRKYHSTTKLVLRAIENASLVRGIEFDPDAILRRLGAQRPYLLYPTSDAHDCESLTLDEDSTVIVVDGTWDEAQKIVFRNPLLRTFPAISFRTQLTSNYRIRKQPKAHCLSTLESIAHLLRLNAAAHGLESSLQQYESLLSGFHQMIDRQIPFHPRFSTAPLTGDKS